MYDVRNVPVEKENLVMSGRGERCRAKSLGRQAGNGLEHIDGRQPLVLGWGHSPEMPCWPTGSLVVDVPV